jgi:SAM-dependent methyltransferase/uncharacterized protein YbaR (Trm112 family)
MEFIQHLQCVRCKSSNLQTHQSVIRCKRCDASYPIFHDVPIFFVDTIIKKTSHPVSSNFAHQMANASYVPPEAENIGTIQSIFSKEYMFGDFLIGVESRQFVDRVKSSGFELPEQPNISSNAFDSQSSIPVNDPDLVRYQWILDYLPRTIQAGKTLTGNVRLSNSGTCMLSSKSDPPIFVAYHWKTIDGNDLIREGIRTPLPIDLMPGQQITVPMKITAPNQPGHYLLEITLVNETVRWFDEMSKQIPIEATSEMPKDLTREWKVTGFNAGSYGADHQRGVDLLKERIKRLGKDSPNILEVGGNANPMIRGLTGKLYNVDVDVYGLQIGKLSSLKAGVNINFICADVNSLPFPDQFFDCIVIFSSLHHFPDLPFTLRELSKKIQPNGFIAVLCEPVGHYFGDNISVELLSELQKGVNEQTFSLTEYANIFRHAGLNAEDVIADVGSLKAFLKPAI